MKRHIRHILFLAFTLIFILSGSYLIFTAQGFVIDFQELKAVRTGAIFLKFSPRDAVLSVDGEASERTQRGILGSGGLILKNLRPGLYDLKISKEGYYDWTKQLEVASGLITSESQVKLWPNEFPTGEPARNNVRDFWLTEGGPVYQDRNGKISFGDSTLKGGQIVLAGQKSKFIVTKEEDNYFLIDLDTPQSAVNLSHLFNSLKQRQLGLPGTVPITEVFFHSFSQNKILVSSRTSLYAIDLKKIEIEKLVTLENIKSVQIGANEAFVIDSKGKLAIINLLLKTSLSEPMELGEVAKMELDPDGAGIYFLSPEGEFQIYERSSGKINILATEVTSFKISPEGKRAILVRAESGLELIFLKQFEGDIKYEAGTAFKIPTPNGEVSDLLWLPNSQNYAAFLNDKTLIFQEIDSRQPINSNSLIEGVKKYEIKGKKIYILKENGEFIFSSTVAGAELF